MADLDVVMGEGGISVKIGDKTFKASPLKIGDFAKFRAWVREQKLSVFMKSASEIGLDPKIFSAGIDRILSPTRAVTRDEATGEMVADDPVINEMFTEGGLAYLLWLSIKKKHPKVKLEDIAVGFDDMVKLVELVTRLSGLALPEGGEEADAEGNPPT